MKEVRPRSSQTLERGIRLLQVLAEEPRGLSISEIATRLNTHRTNVYRLLTSLMHHRLVRRSHDGRYVLGLGIMDLARGVSQDLRMVAFPVLTELAEKAQATAFLTVADGEDAVALLVVEPRTTNIHVAYRTGFRHPITRGASGIAILAGRPPRPDERTEVKLARERGFAVSEGELQRGAVGVAAPIIVNNNSADASVGVVTLGDLNLERVAPLIRSSAAAIAQALYR